MSNLFDINTDINEALNKYSLLKHYTRNGANYLRGEIEVIDPITGRFIDIFSVEIFYPENYPKCFPKVTETENKIPKETSRHIMTNTDNLCFSVEVEEKLVCQHGIRSLWFLDNIVMPRLAEEFRVSRGEKYQKEYSHDFGGTWEFLMNKFEINDQRIILTILEALVNKKLPNNDKPCLCDSGMIFRDCHRPSVISLQQLGIKYLKNLLDKLKTVPYTGPNL